MITEQTRLGKNKTEDRKFTILYVDDEETNLRGFKSNFRRFYNIIVINNPIDAISILKERPVQIIITDQRMPEMTGTEFLQTILPDFPDEIKIILTGFTDIEAIKDGVNSCGIYKYITKPWNFDEMKAVLDRAIETYLISEQTEDHIKELESTNEQLEKRVAERTHELNSINKKLINSIKYAGELQKSMLPSKGSLERLFKDHFLVYETRYLFSEDFIWSTTFNFRTEDYTVIALMEFDGKGIIGSLKTLISDSILNELIHDRKIFHSGDIIRYLKEELDAAGSNDLICDLKASVLVIDNYHKTLQFSGLGQDMILFNKGTEMIILEGESEDKINDLDADKLGIQENTSIYLFTNGFCNQTNSDGIKFGHDKFEELLKSIYLKNMKEQGDFMRRTINDWINESGMVDDMTVFGFRLPPD